MEPFRPPVRKEQGHGTGVRAPPRPKSFNELAPERAAGNEAGGEFDVDGDDCEVRAPTRAAPGRARAAGAGGGL